ncbi:hypothetical protein LXL04_012445 [Taraxacum kok-saghyz]
MCNQVFFLPIPPENVNAFTMVIPNLTPIGVSTAGNHQPPLPAPAVNQAEVVIRIPPDIIGDDLAINIAPR